MDEVVKKVEKDIEVLEDQIQSYSLHDQDQYFQTKFMLEYKERVLLPFSFEIEEEYPVFENQFDNTQLKYFAAEQSIYELSKAAECLENHQTNYVFYDHIADNMEEFYSSNFQLCFHYEDQIQLMLPW